MGFPGGVLVRDGETGTTTYTLIGSLKGCDPYANDRAPESAGEMGSFYNLLLDLEENIIHAAVENSVKWFGKKRSEEAIRDSFKRIISTSTDRVDGEYIPNGKYPIIGRNYESTNNKKLFFIGSLMHSNDYKQSAGGFIHGFRYLIEYFFHLNYDGKFDIINFTNKNLNSLVNHILYRINYSSSIYQMYGQIVDLFIYNTKTKMINYINNVHPSFLRSPSTDVDLVYFMLSLEYSNKIENDNISQLGVRTTSIGTESNAILLHPIIRVLKDFQGINKALIDTIHFDEDLFADFTDKMRYGDKLMRTLKMFIN
jgi:hypothetical protein